MKIMTTDKTYSIIRMLRMYKLSLKTARTRVVNRLETYETISDRQMLRMYDERIDEINELIHSLII